MIFLIDNLIISSAFPNQASSATQWDKLGLPVQINLKKL